ncbi:hypothetical protein PR202_ga17305 [Eleusine coracana subsp. coracana]|uniref:Uncharacterized protein n=1 Tax=Eleusine coracana subsp. coracana TaxID=191504 RepID=A0AAV5CQ47_ELECO|nr:hypothetical protein PR202_ga17305 [Eleusine coracana subsp. coracana]
MPSRTKDFSSRGLEAPSARFSAFPLRNPAEATAISSQNRVAAGWFQSPSPPPMPLASTAVSVTSAAACCSRRRCCFGHVLATSSSCCAVWRNGISASAGTSRIGRSGG